MTVQIFEPFAGRHHTKYVSHLMPPLVRMLDAGHITRIVLTTTRSHRESTYFKDMLEPHASQVYFDGLEREAVHAGHDVAGMLLASLRRVEPDCLISTSANNGALSLALRSALGFGFGKRDLVSVGVLHNGFYAGVRGLSDRTRDGVQRFARHFAPWSETQVVNPLLYEYIRDHEAWSAGRMRLLPDPVEIPRPIEKAAARTLLQIPVDGTYIGQIGRSDPRKAIPELLAAFAATDPEPHRRLLLAGALYEPYRALIDERYRRLLHSGQLVLLDRYLTPDEVHAANCAMDVVAVATYTDQLSGTLLSAVAARRPVLGAADGYAGSIIRRFGVGYAAPIKEHAALTSAVALALRSFPGFTISPAAERLLQYHDPENFANALLRLLRERLGLPRPAVKTWEWALTGDSESREAILDPGYIRYPFPAPPAISSLPPEAFDAGRQKHGA